MKPQALLVFVFGLIVFLGGLMGFLKAQSIISLVTGSAFAILLISSGFLFIKGSSSAFILAMTSVIILALFFGYRFYLTGLFMPAGLMLILSVIVLAVLTMLQKNSPA